MPTHQDIGGISDEELLQRLVTSHAERYGEAFWAFFDAEVGSAYRRGQWSWTWAAVQGCFCVISAGAIPQRPCTVMT